MVIATKWKLARPSVLALVVLSAVLLVLMMVPAPFVPTGFSAIAGSYVPLVAIFLSEIRSVILPSGWIVLGFQPGEAAAEIYLASAAQLAFILDFPIIAYVLLRPVVRAPPERRTPVASRLAVVVSLLFGAGSIVGLFLTAPSLLILSDPFLGVVGPLPVMNPWDFYHLAFQSILLTGFSLSIPVWLYECIVQARMKYVRQLPESVQPPNLAGPA